MRYHGVVIVDMSNEIASAERHGMIHGIGPSDVPAIEPRPGVRAPLRQIVKNNARVADGCQPRLRVVCAIVADNDDFEVLVCLCK